MKEKIIDVLIKILGLKGRVIANKISLDKNSVNSFLYHDESGGSFKQQNEWFLTNDTVVIKFNKTG